MLLFITIVWIYCGIWGTYIIIKSEVDYESSFFKNVTYFELFKIVKWVLIGPITLFLITKWMFEEEDLGNKKVFGKNDDSNTKI